ncbi:MAG TPA: paraquat-inducible protein A [Marinobacter sp.]|nr:paraquat-inducible protein A [Marinobacter sp.]
MTIAHQQTAPSLHLRLAACPDCDQLIQAPTNPDGHLHCPVCQKRLFELETFTPAAPLAIALAALILAVPANLYPQLGFSLLGQTNHYTLTGGALHLMEQGFWWVGSLVLAGTVIAPLLLLLLITSASVTWYLRLPSGYLKFLLRSYQHLVNWAMLDVYLLSVIVSVVKLKTMGQLDFTLGFYCFIAMMLLTSAAVVAFKTGPFWDLLEHAPHARH